MRAFDKWDASRKQRVTVGMIMGGQICLWRGGSPMRWKFKNYDDFDLIERIARGGGISTDAYDTGRYRQTAWIDPHSNVLCIPTAKSLSRYGMSLTAAEFVEVVPPSSKQRRNAGQTFEVEEAVTAAVDVAYRRGEVLIVGGYAVESPSIMIGRSFKDGRATSIMAASPPPGGGALARGEARRLPGDLRDQLTGDPSRRRRMHGDRPCVVRCHAMGDSPQFCRAD